MLVMPYAAFKAQGRIFRSVKAWREEALRDGRLVVHAEAGRDHRGKIVVFISHTWWDREFLDPERDPSDPYDKGAPDYQSGDKKDLKWRTICSGVESLVERKGLKEEEVVLWVDWQSIYQDDKPEKKKGVLSLLKYATLCDYMLVPTKSKAMEGDEAYFPEEIPGYGARGWCRCEYFIFSLAAEMREREVELYAILAGGGLHQYPAVKVEGARFMPSGGAFANPADKASVQGLEDEMIKTYGKAVVLAKCKAGGAVDLSNKMLRAVHMDALGAVVAKYKVKALNLQNNQLGADGGKTLAAVMSHMPSLEELNIGGNNIGVEGGKAFAAVLKDTQLTNLNIGSNGLGVDGGKAIAAALKDTQITNLILRGNYVGAEGGVAIAEALKGNTSLKELDVAVNDLGVEGSKAFAAVLKDTQLTNLSVDGHVLLINELKGTRPAEKIDLSNKKLGVASAFVIAACIKENGVLKELNIAHNYIGFKGGKAIAEGLKGNTTLQKLNLNGNAICGLDQIGRGTYSAEGITKLCEALKASAVTSLSLQKNNLNDDAKRAVQAAAGNRVNLTL